MGNECSSCGNKATEGKYCKRCYERRFPVCKHCKKPIRDGEAKFGGCHKNPCYNNMTRRCCECNGTASDGSYCKSCYDKKFPPPLRAVASGGGMTFKLYSREEPNQRMIDFAKYSLGQGMNRPLTGRQQ
ncbi:hypothetical protein pdam_00004573, partial [Pocillopora damicornis]